VYPSLKKRNILEKLLLRHELDCISQIFLQSKIWLQGRTYGRGQGGRREIGGRVVHRSIESPVCAIVAFPPGSLFVYTDRTDTCIQGRVYRILEEVLVV
jgi:hypothetical protein